MKYGVREICDVVLKRKSAGFFGRLYLDKDMPVLYFDTLKTSSLEGASETVYAQGGRGNPRLVAWEGDRTLTFTMEDALISPESFNILSGAGFMDASTDNKVYIHHTEEVQIKYVKLTDGKVDQSATMEMRRAAEEADNHMMTDGSITISLAHPPAKAGDMYIMLKNEDGSINTNRIPVKVPKGLISQTMELDKVFDAWAEDYNQSHAQLIEQGKIMSAVAPQPTADQVQYEKYKDFTTRLNKTDVTDKTDLYDINNVVDYVTGANIDYPGSVVFVDYYVASEQYTKQIEIEAGKFGGSYYLEASTLFRDQGTGEDFPAEFVIPNCKVQSNFTFTMAPTGDPSTFTFTLDAFPDYTKFDKTKKVLAAIQIIEDKDLYDGAGAEDEDAMIPVDGLIFEDSGKNPPPRFGYDETSDDTATYKDAAGNTPDASYKKKTESTPTPNP